MRRLLFVLRRSSHAEARPLCRPSSLLQLQQHRRCHQHPGGNRPSFGIAFDIDGVVLRGRTPIGGSPLALRRLYTDDGILKIPFLFLTNGGGVRESKRACELSRLLEVDISPLQVMQGHSPFKGLVSRFENELIVAVGKGEPADVMSEYGFHSFYGRVLCDILRSGGLPGKENGDQPPLFFASDDLEYQAAFPYARLGMGAFRLALECIFNRINHNPLEYTSFGKPNPFVFKNAEAILKQLSSNIFSSAPTENVDTESSSFKTIYMIGDNPSIDIKGAKKAGQPWFSILTRTGVFRGKQNHSQFPADLVVDTVEEAVDYILRRERT